MPIARQLPVYSPLPLRALAAAVAPGDPRAALGAALRVEYDADEVVLTSSGTAALTLALQAAGARRAGLPVAMPGYACYDLISAALGAGVRVALYDLDPGTLAPEPASLARALEGGAAALVVVHLFGVPVPLDAMRAAADAAGALLVEDAAQAAGGSWAGRPLGAHGDIGVLSFGRGKGVTGGGGGALLLRRGVARASDLLERISPSAERSAPFIAKLAAQWALGRPALYGIPASMPMLRLGEAIYREPVPPRAMPPISARVLMSTRPEAAAEAAVRRASGAAFRDALGAAGRLRAVAPPAGGEPGWLRFPVRGSIPSSLVASGLPLGLATAYPLPLRSLPAAAAILARLQPTPHADELAATLRTLPTHRLVDRHSRARIEAWLSALAGSGGR